MPVRAPWAAFGLVLVCASCSELPPIDGALCDPPLHDCPEGYYCGTEHYCKVALPISVECETPADCDEGLVCDAAYKACRSCRTDGECPGHAVCIAEESRCVQCRTDADCPTGRCAGYQCLACTSDSECRKGVQCTKVGQSAAGSCATCPGGDPGECTTNYCVNKVCRSCKAGECPPGLVCEEGSCVTEGTGS